MFLAHSLMAIFGFTILCVAATYAVLTLVARIAWQGHGEVNTSAGLPPVTILKPLCGAEPGLYEHLRSFCRQDYPEFQIVFGLRDPADPARSVVERLRAEFPSLRIDIVVNPQQHGSNRKTSNLINMFARARHDVLAMADSDVFVGPDYLHTVTAPLMDPDVGLVTCIYQDIPTGRIWSRLGAMYINEWYVPSVLLAWLFGHQGYASGQTLCLRRDTLQAVGGLQAISNHLAEDYRLGELIRGLGQRIVLSHYVVKGQHHEQDLDSLARHELRWMRTLRALRPRSFRLIFLTFTLPLALLGVILAGAGSSPPIAAWMLCGTTIAARLMLHFVHRLGGDRPLLCDFWLLPVQDLLICWVWCQSFLTSQITWRGVKFDVGVDGILRNERGLRKAAYVGGLLGVALLAALLIRTDSAAMVQTLRLGGWMLLWLIPYRALFYLLYAACWLVLLRPYNPGHEVGLGYVFWATSVRDAIDRLLPVASVGGGVIGIRLLRWRGVATGPASASVIVEVALTVIVLYAFVGLGLILLTEISATGEEYHRLLLGFLFILPVPVLTMLLLRYGAVFERLRKLLRKFADGGWLPESAASVDSELRAYFSRRWTLTIAGLLQFAALISGSFEVWFALRLFGHPVSAATALVLESMTQAVRHLAFVVPAGVGVQEAGLVLFGQAFGISSELALAVSMAKRIREVLCGLPSLISWQWLEGRRLRGLMPNAS